MTMKAMTYKDLEGRLNLLGPIEEQTLQEMPYSVWFEPEYKKYTPNFEIIEELQKYKDQFSVEIFFGTWCGDSRREVPRMYKILDTLEFDSTKIETIALGHDGDLYKKSPGGETEGKDIERIPTFIFYSTQGKEINRIVESPVDGTLEQDMLEIVSGQPYKDKYHLM